MRYFTFDGVRSDSFFLTSKITTEILPSVDFDTVKIAGKQGVVAFASQLAGRNFNIECTIMKNSNQEIRSLARTIAKWLYTKSDKILSFSDEPNVHYLARFKGNIDIEEQANMGKIKLTFFASDPIAYGQSRSTSIATLINALTSNQSGVEASTAGLVAYSNSGQATLTRDTTTAYTGSASAKIAKNNTGTENIRLSTDIARSTVTATKRYTFSCYVKANVAKGIQCKIYAYNSSNQMINYVEGDVYTATPNVWEIHSVEFLMPVGTVTAYVEVEMIGATQGNYFNYDEGVFSTVTNRIIYAGTAPTYPQIVFVPTSAISSGIRFTNSTTGKYIQLNGSFTSGKSYTIDMNVNRAYETNTPANSIMNQVDIASDFWAMQQGENTIGVSVSNVTTTLNYTERFY